jgi:hypothetical protein
MGNENMNTSSMKKILLLAGWLILSTSVFAGKHDGPEDGLKNAVILVIRHAEKPDSGDSLSPAGQERAQAYVDYFKNFVVDSKPLKLDYLFSAANSKASQRPRLTIEPLSKALGLTIDSQFAGNKVQKLADAIRKKPSGKQYLISWHHGEIPQLVSALGADPDTLFPRRKWPDDVFGWVIQLRYDSDGHLMDASRINENLMPDDQPVKL